jgi:ribosome-associated protein
MEVHSFLGSRRSKRQQSGILFKSMSERTQEGNRRVALERLEALIRAAMIEPKIRKKTRPTKASKERRIDSKKRRGTTKQSRGGHGWD